MPPCTNLSRDMNNFFPIANTALPSTCQLILSTLGLRVGFSHPDPDHPLVKQPFFPRS